MPISTNLLRLVHASESSAGFPGARSAPDGRASGDTPHNFRPRVLAALAFVLFGATPASASAALTLDDVRIGAQPAYVRVVVDVTGGSAEINEAEATDP